MAANQLDDVIQRWDIVKSMGSGLLGPLIKEVVRKERDSVHCQAVITHLIQSCSPDDVLNVLLRQVEETDRDAIAVTITLLMQHIQPVLMMLDDSKPVMLSLALDALHKQISKLPVPYTRKQEEEDEHGLGCCCAALLTFVQPFVQEVKRQDSKSPVTDTYRARLKTVLLKFCMESLREPLLEAQLDRETHTSQNSHLWIFATEIMSTLSAINEPLPKLLFYCPLRRKGDEKVVREDESRASLAYLLFVQLIAIDLFPAVFRCTMKTSHHAGVESVILTNIKNQVEYSSKSEQMDSWFKGTLLIVLLKDTLSLHQDPEMDLLHGMDRKITMILQHRAYGRQVDTVGQILCHF
ncbi:glomulin-like [Clarias magur]|uniref:Glomulin-like n=1 Tax=Clarias magur TaxID=1594786 RepID=A0A8J4TM33_CLAMG|nr:glomulin-like [Clarias magur]